MPAPSTFLLFCAAAAVLIVIPGPAVLFVVARSVEHGRRAGLVSALGTASGAVVHVAAAAVGLSSLLASSATAFSIVKYAGAAYLIVLGVRRLVGRERAAGAPRPPRVSRRRLYRQAVVVSVLNPKEALFFLAFLPQFVDSSRGSVALQVLALGLCFLAIALVSDSLWAIAAGTAGDRLRRSARFVRAERLVAGSALLALGVAAAASGQARRR